MTEVKSAFQAFQVLINDIKSQIQEIEMSKVKQMIEYGSIDSAVIDLREEADYNKSHLPNAIHLDRGLLEVEIEKEFPNKDQKLYLYCGDGSRSSLATLNLQKVGYKNAVSISGGFREWMKLSEQSVND